MPDLTTHSLFRPIHYLGSKLRFLDFIEQTINEIDPSNNRVCDLFSGSGTVSFKLSKHRSITSVDIQNYSKVICTAILNPSIPDKDYISEFINKCIESDFSKSLDWVIKPISNFENSSIDKALESKKNGEILCDIIENGSLVSYEILTKCNGSKNLKKKIKDTYNRIEERQIEKSDLKVLRYFGGIYFSYSQSMKIDSILKQLKFIDPIYRDFFLASLLSTVSEIVNTVGKQFAQPIRPRNSSGEIKPSLGKIVNRDRTLDVIEVYRKWVEKYSKIKITKFHNTIIKDDYSSALDLLPIDTKVVYADPPYTRDHYSRFYHVLETISIGDDPKISTMVLKGRTLLSRGLYRQDRHQSPFCIRSQAPSAFETMFKKISERDMKLVLSYSPFNKKTAHPRVMDLKRIDNLGKKYFKNVEIISTGEFSHSKLTNSAKHKKASNEAEVLIVCQ